MKLIDINKAQPAYGELLLQSAVDTNRDVSRPPILLSIAEQYGEQRIFTLGNFSSIIGKAKAKKTFLVSMFTAAIINPGGLYERLRNYRPADRPLILYFDTEQGEWDCWNVIRRIETMSRRDENFRAFNLRPFSPEERRGVIDYAFTQFGDRCCYCVIDGIADLVNDFNDAIEATETATMLMRLTHDYNCHITTLIHQNKNDNFATGHLGSAIMKKSEILIEVKPSAADRMSSVVSSNLSRGMGFADFLITINDGIPIFGDINPDQKTGINFYNEPKNECPF
jgi:hypothetical protein